MMGQPYHGRRRRRPRWRLRYRGGGLAPRPGSYQAFGLRYLHDLVLPGIRGGDRRRFFNDVSGGLAVWFGVLGAAIGWGMIGPFGVLLGFGAGVVFGAGYLTRNRYFRA
jgi:hypothetical protein